MVFRAWTRLNRVRWSLFLVAGSASLVGYSRCENRLGRPRIMGCFLGVWDCYWSAESGRRQCPPFSRSGGYPVGVVVSAAYRVEVVGFGLDREVDSSRINYADSGS
ncbi:unnamed protein product [Macrosiphum euphorbiae]|uniref:Secreted protein n=1 Tax=Macrosiphum euphorbiae TaxID=13131 RepID=A0AAV0YAG0_9HEMI|nr:unnamed protein product [Macrosiphum euphorbiae]